MNDQDKNAYQAEIDRLNETIKWYQGQAGQRIGEAARAGIVGAPAERAAPINLPTNDEVYAEVCRLRESNFYVSTNACYDVMHAARRLVASAPAAPLREQTGLSEALEALTLPIEALIARYHAEVWEAAAGDGIAYDEAGRATAKKIVAALRALAAGGTQTAISEGHRLVPIDPTDDMTDAACDASNLFRVDFVRAWGAALSVALAATPSPAPAPTEPQHDIEARTERIRLSHANADSKGKIQLRREVEWLLAHIALLRSPQDGLVSPLVAAPVSRHEACRTCGVEVGGQHAPDCVYEGEASEGYPGKGAAGARKIVSYGACKCVLSHYCDGRCNPLFADEAPPASRMGGITSKESAETAAPGASIGDKQ